MRLRRDDGAVIYINDVEVLRSNMPEGEVSYTTWASGAASDDGDTVYAEEIGTSTLSAGENIIAVEVHQATADSSDLSFDLELVAHPAIPRPGTFIRGDGNGDGHIDISDAVVVLRTLFGGHPHDCHDALDANDSGIADIADAVYTLSYLFAGGPAPPAPFPDYGLDPTGDDLDCLW